MCVVPTNENESKGSLENRRFRRVKAWALEQPHERLAILFSGVLLTLSAERKRGRIKEEIHGLQRVQLERAVISATAERIAVEAEHSIKRRYGGRKRAAGRPAVQAKESVRSLWNEWQSGMRPQIRTVEQFATEAARQCGGEVAIGTIAKWSAKWSRERRIS